MSVVPESLGELGGVRRLPSEFVERAEAYFAGTLEIVAPRHAATVALLRDAVEGLEVYTLRRQRTMAFASGMYVFPGGSVDARDAQAAVGWVGPPAEFWAQAFGAPVELAKALVCAAVRETFEESGVLLAGPDADSVVADTTGEEWERERRALIAQELGLAEFLARRGLCVRADLLRPWAHWITPAVEPMRFDTRFFLATIPAGQRTREFGEEADQVEWLRPNAAIERWRAKDLQMMPPTLITLAEIAEHSDAAAALAAAGARSIRTVEPEIVVRDGRAMLVLPDHPDHSDYAGRPGHRAP